jgi:archaetidylinositol phosphate synthase
MDMTSEGARLDVSALPVPGISLGDAKRSIPFANAIRLQESFTARVERKALAWLTARLPSWVNSDHLTLLGFAAMILAGASYALARTNRIGLLLATGCLALNWFGDSLDGTLARLRNRQRPRYGFYVDHMIDTLGGFFLMGGLAISGIVDWRIALGMFIAFLMLSVEVYLSAYTLGTFRLSFAKFGPTEIRILLALGNTALWFHPDARISGSSYRVFDLGGIVAIAGMALMLVVSTVCHTVKLYRAETLDSSSGFRNCGVEGFK